MSPGIRDQKAGGKRGKRLPSGESGEAGSAPSLLARKGVQGPLQGLCTTIERTARSGIPPLRLPEALIFLRFRVFFFRWFSVFFRVATLPAAAGRQCIAWLLQKLDFRGFPYISGFFLGGNVLFTLLRLQSPIIRIHGSQRDISSVADHERSDGDEILLSSTG